MLFDIAGATWSLSQILDASAAFIVDIMQVWMGHLTHLEKEVSVYLSKY
jgi:hypothetical protein